MLPALHSALAGLCLCLCDCGPAAAAPLHCRCTAAWLRHAGEREGGAAEPSPEWLLCACSPHGLPGTHPC